MIKISDDKTLEIELIRTLTNSYFVLVFPFCNISLNVFVKERTDSIFKCLRYSS